MTNTEKKKDVYKSIAIFLRAIASELDELATYEREENIDVREEHPDD